MRRIVPLKSLTVASGGRGLIELDQLPPEHYLHGILFNLPITFVAPGSAQAAVLPRTFNRVIDQLKVGRRISTTGQAIDVLNWLLHGRDQSATDYIPANANGTLDRVVNLFFPFADPTGYEPDDCAPAVELFKDTPIEVAFGSLTTLFPSFTSITPGIFQAHAVIRKGTPGKVATPINVDVVDLTPDSRLDPGVYTHVALMKEDGTAITSAEVTGISLYIDGVPVIDNAPVSALAALFNATKAEGSLAAATATTTPFLSTPGEAVNEEPGGAVAAGSGVSVEFLPLLYPAHAGKLTQAWTAASGIRIKWSGSATSLRAVTRRVEPVSDAAVVKAAQKMGLAAPSSVRPATASRADTSPWKAAVLPKKVPAVTK